MSDFNIWAFNRTAPNEFAVTVSAVPELPDDMHRARVEVQVAATLDASMLLAMGERVRARGDRVVDVE